MHNGSGGTKVLQVLCNLFENFPSSSRKTHANQPASQPEPKTRIIKLKMEGWGGKVC